jgi:hypothetical protein
VPKLHDACQILAGELMRDPDFRRVAAWDGGLDRILAGLGDWLSRTHRSAAIVSRHLRLAIDDQLAAQADWPPVQDSSGGSLPDCSAAVERAIELCEGLFPPDLYQD